jgi:hypothetical protein
MPHKIYIQGHDTVAGLANPVKVIRFTFGAKVVYCRLAYKKVNWYYRGYQEARLTLFFLRNA